VSSLQAAKRVRTFFNPTINVAARSSIRVFQADGPGSLLFFQVADGGRGFIGYSLVDLSLQPENLLVSLFVSANADFTLAKSRGFLFPFVEVQLLTLPAQAGAVSGLPASSTFSASTRAWAGSFNTDAAGNLINEVYQWHVPIPFTRLELSITNFGTAAIACSVKAIIA
jgi:hypothetical protein